MKNNFITKIIGATLAFAMMIGGAVGINAAKQAKEVDADGYVWQKMTSTSEFVDGTTFLVTQGNYYLDVSNTSTSQTPRLAALTLTNNLPSLTADNTNCFTVSGTGDSIKLVKSTNNNVWLITGTSNNAARINTGTTGHYWTILDGPSSGQFYLRSNASTARYLSRYQTTDFRSYTNTDTNANLVLYKLVSTAGQEVTEATSMSISPSGPISAVVGDTVIFTPTLTGGSGGYEKTIGWVSSNTSVAASPANSEDGQQVSVSLLAAGSTTITGTVVDPGSASASITINAKEVSSISVTTAPTRTTYNEGDSFDPSGMVVTATYSDSSTEDVTADCTFTPDPLTEETTEVTVTYGGKTTTQAVTVNPIVSVTFTAGTDLGSTSANNSADQVSKSGFTISSTDAAFATAQYRLYSGSETTFSVSSGRIGTISMVRNGSYAYSVLSLKEGEPGTWNSSTGVWTGSASSVTFVASAQFRADSFTIAKASTEQTLTVDPLAITLKTYNSTGITITAATQNVDNPTFEWTKNNNNILLVATQNPNEITVKPNTNVDATAKVFLDVGGADPAFDRVEINVTLEAPVKGEIPEMAYTVAEAIESIDNQGDQPNVYVEGIISDVTSYSSQYHSLTYHISDDGTTTSDQFEIYSGKGLNGADFSSVDDLVVGSSVIVYGTIKLHNGVYEFGANSSIHSLQLPPQVNSITLTPSDVTVDIDESGDVADLFTNISINQDNGSNKTVADIVWTSDDADIFYIDGDEYLVTGSHRTSTTIRASIGGTEYASATIHVLDSSIHSVPYDVAIEWEIVADPSTLVAGDKVLLTGIKDGKTYAAGLYAGGNNVPAYSSELTVSGNKVTGVVDDMIYTLVAGDGDGTLAFKDSEGNYLYAASSSSNHLKAQSTIDGNASFALNSTGAVVAQGSYTHKYMRYNTSNNLFACYDSSSSTGSFVTFYKRIGGYRDYVDLTSASSTATLHATESNEGGNLTLSDVKIRFGAKLSISEWEAIEAIGNITDYGVMLFRTRNAITSATPVQDAIDNGKTPTVISKGSGEVPSDPENGYYSFTGTVNITNDSNYDLVFCAAPFIEVDGTTYFLDELQFSVNSLANYIIDNNVETELSDDALLLLA